MAVIQDNNRQYADIIALSNITRESERFIDACKTKMLVSKDADVLVKEEIRDNKKVICTYWMGEPVEPYRRGLVKRVKDFKDE